MTHALFPAKQREPVEFGPLAELLVEGFAPDQVWEELQLRNQPLLRYYNKHIAKLLRPGAPPIAFFPEGKKKKKNAAAQSDINGEDLKMNEDGSDAEDAEQDQEEVCAIDTESHNLLINRAVLFFLFLSGGGRRCCRRTR